VLLMQHPVELSSPMLFGPTFSRVIALELSKASDGFPKTCFGRNPDFEMAWKFRKRNILPRTSPVIPYFESPQISMRREIQGNLLMIQSSVS
jgi:hypothetical protein